MELRYLSLENLTVATINARTHGATEDLESLAASIQALGLLQPLLVRPVAESEGFEIVAGQRRFLACRRLAQEAPVEPLPCFVLAATDDAAALEISLAENLERLPMEPFDQHEAFAQLVKLGQSVDAIAARFGVTERLVQQRLALAGLIDAIKREARKGADRDRRRPTAGAGDAQATKGVVQAVSGPGAVRAAGQPAQGVAVRRRGDCNRGGAVPAWRTTAGGSSPTCSASSPISTMPRGSGRCKTRPSPNGEIGCWPRVGPRSKCWKSATISAAGSISGPPRAKAVGC